MMSCFIRLLCRSETRLTVGFVTDFLRDGVYFEVLPDIEAEPSSDMSSRFERIDIQYDKKKRPVIITSAVGDEVTEEVAELIELARLSGISDLLRQQIAATRQIVAIEIDRDKLTEDVWGFCDCIEAEIAAQLDGIIFVPDDGIYDMKLQLMERM